MSNARPLSSSLKDENQDLRLGSSFRMWLAERQRLQERQVPEHEQEKKLQGEHMRQQATFRQSLQKPHQMQQRYLSTWLQRRSMSSMASASAEKISSFTQEQMPTTLPFSSTETADITIVGAGIMGLSVAYQLKRRDPALNVVVLERASGLGAGSSGWSTGFLRAFYSFDHTMELQSVELMLQELGRVHRAW